MEPGTEQDAPDASEPVRQFTAAELDDYLQRELQALKASGTAYEIHHTVQVTSFGGSGTTALCRHLIDGGVDLQPGPAQWPFKHRRPPPTAAEVPEGFRVVYPLADPRDAVLSLFRRDYQVGHYRSLWERDPDDDAAAHLRDRDAFLEAGVDEFALAEHFHGWRDHPPGYPVMFVRYDRLAEAWPELAAFVGRPQLPPFVWRERASSWQQLDPSRRQRLQEMYGALADEIAALPAVSVS